MFWKNSFHKDNRNRPVGRIVAETKLADSSNLSLEMIQAGYAWHYTSYSKDTAMDHTETLAGKNKRGFGRIHRPRLPGSYENKIKERQQIKILRMTYDEQSHWPFLE
jgi:endonuclease YncB( thermonuclease family)